jgi:hypothetical protein
MAGHSADHSAAGYSAGYSGTPLAKKLGIKEGHRLLLVNAPEGFGVVLGELPEGVSVVAGAGKGSKPFDVMLFFTTARSELEKRLPSFHARMAQNGGLWVCWPKKAAKVATDVTEDVVRAVALPMGLVDNKVCAVDDTWSGLRLVIRLKDRK